MNNDFLNYKGPIHIASTKKLSDEKGTSRIIFKHK